MNMMSITISKGTITNKPICVKGTKSIGKSASIDAMDKPKQILANLSKSVPLQVASPATIALLRLPRIETALIPDNATIRDLKYASAQNPPKEGPRLASNRFWLASTRTNAVRAKPPMKPTTRSACS